MLDIECFTYLNALLESPMAPTVIFATNRGHTLVRGTTDIYSAHGIPVDLLDRYYPSLPFSLRVLMIHRCLIVKTEPYDRGQVAKVVNVRANVEGIKLGPGVLDRLATEGERASLRLVLSFLCSICRCVDITHLNSRYALQLLTPASIVASLSGRKEVLLEDIGELTELFLDAKTSATKISSDGDLH
jgi:RuvB-like protein 1